MIINTDITIAYKCSSCGTFQFANTSLFKAISQRQIHIRCKCKGSNLTIKKERFLGCRAIVPCIGCGRKHSYSLDTKIFTSSKVAVLNCPETGITQCFIGKDQEVRRWVDNLEREFDEIINTLGYDNYFANTQVMFDTLNMIHDIAEKGNLFCECGNNDIELLLFSDRIYLRCRKCSAQRMFYAFSNQHLKDNLKMGSILLFKKQRGMDMPRY
ncbi:MAG: hypothetical protein GX992_03815 [Clostridium sp.]|nr:hypothetical protein [Clostridium sp.]